MRKGGGSIKNWAAGALLAYAVLALLLCLPAYDWRALTARDGADPVSQHEVQTQPLREALPRRGTVGYVRVQPWVRQLEPGFHYRLQYFLAPLVLDASAAAFSRELALVESVCEGEGCTPRPLEYGLERRQFPNLIYVLKGRTP